MSIESKDITVVLQGGYSAELTPVCVKSVRKHLPESTILLSTWEGTNYDKSLSIDEVILSKDPGAKTRDGKPNGKLNNINRQIVSSRNGMRHAKTAYALKLRTDFLMQGTGFLEAFGKYSSFDPEYRIVKQRIICCMFGTRWPQACHYNLPYHVSDFSTFGITADLLNLYEIDLVTDEEFNWFLIHNEYKPDTFAVNKYNAEQSIIVNYLTKNGAQVPCEYSTHVDDRIADLSNRYLVNNFYPMPFGAYGIQPLKSELKAVNTIYRYTDYITQYEWCGLYKELCDPCYTLVGKDIERVEINRFIRLERWIVIIKKFENRMPEFLRFISKLISYIKTRKFPQFL